MSRRSPYGQDGMTLPKILRSPCVPFKTFPLYCHTHRFIVILCTNLEFLSVTSSLSCNCRMRAPSVSCHSTIITFLEHFVRYLGFSLYITLFVLTCSPYNGIEYEYIIMVL